MGWDVGMTDSAHEETKRRDAPFFHLPHSGCLLAPLVLPLTATLNLNVLDPCN